MNWCCCTWLDLCQELAEMKVAQLEKLLKRGIPRSTFSPVFRLIEGIGNFCPNCGTQIGTKLEENVGSLPEVPKKRVEPESVSKTPPLIKCPVCRGTGKVGDDLNCMICLGQGQLDKSNPHRANYDQAYSEELAEKMAENERKKEKIAEEIRKNPKPLREDAKPENWKK